MAKKPQSELDALLAEQSRLTARQVEIARLLEAETTPLGDLAALAQEKAENAQVLAAIGPRLTAINTAIREERDRKHEAHALARRPREFETIQAFEAWLAAGVECLDDCHAMAQEIGQGARCIPDPDLERLVRHYHGEVLAGRTVKELYTDWSGKAA